MNAWRAIALADELHAHLDRGDLIGLAAVDLGSDGVWDDVDRATRILLADVAQRLEQGAAFECLVPGAGWSDLAAQLFRLDEAIHERLSERERHWTDARCPTRLGRWEWEIEADRISWSDEHVGIWGTEPQPGPLTFEAALERVHPDDVERVRAAIEACIATGQPFEYDMRVVRVDGEICRIRIRGALVRNAAGRPVWMAGDVHEIANVNHPD